jgi:hypothetical protein
MPFHDLIFFILFFSSKFPFTDSNTKVSQVPIPVNAKVTCRAWKDQFIYSEGLLRVNSGFNEFLNLTGIIEQTAFQSGSTFASTLVSIIYSFSINHKLQLMAQSSQKVCQMDFSVHCGFGFGSVSIWFWFWFWFWFGFSFSFGFRFWFWLSVLVLVWLCDCLLSL